MKSVTANNIKARTSGSDAGPSGSAGGFGSNLGRTLYARAQPVGFGSKIFTSYSSSYSLGCLAPTPGLPAQPVGLARTLRTLYAKYKNK